MSESGSWITLCSAVESTGSCSDAVLNNTEREQERERERFYSNSHRFGNANWIYWGESVTLVQSWVTWLLTAFSITFAIESKSCNICDCTQQDGDDFSLQMFRKIDSNVLFLVTTTNKPQMTKIWPKLIYLHFHHDTKSKWKPVNEFLTGLSHNISLTLGNENAENIVTGIPSQDSATC